MDEKFALLKAFQSMSFSVAGKTISPVNSQLAKADSLISVSWLSSGILTSVRLVHS